MEKTRAQSIGIIIGIVNTGVEKGGTNLLDVVPHECVDRDVGLDNTKISREYPAGRAVDGVAAWLVW